MGYLWGEEWHFRGKNVHHCPTFSQVRAISTLVTQVLCMQGVRGSSPLGSTPLIPRQPGSCARLYIAATLRRMNTWMTD